mgnify:CR=1 FL=1
MARYEDLAPRVQELKRQGKNEEALLLLEQWITATEQEAHRDQMPVESWPYLQACIVLRKLKRPNEEVAMIERFMQQPSSGSKQSQEIVDRIEKAYQLAGLTEIRKVGGASVVYYKPEAVPLDERSIFVREALLLDTETTGLSRADEVIELALLRFRYSHYSGRILEVKDSYVGRREPGCAISPQATRVHGITKSDVAGRQLDYGRIRSMVDGALMVFAHNASFDQRMASKLLPELDRLPWFCTMNGIDWLGKGCSSRKLEDICNTFGVSYGAHRADADVHALLDLFAISDPNTARPLLHEMVRSVPLGYVSSWKMQQEADEDDDDEYEDDDDDGYVSAVVLTLNVRSDRTPSMGERQRPPQTRQPAPQAAPAPTAPRRPSKAFYIVSGLLATVVTLFVVSALVMALMSFF